MNIKEMLHLHLFDGEAGDGLTSDNSEVEEPEIVYGKADETVVEDEAEEPEDLDAEFDELINGKFKDVYGARVQESILKRFKGNAERDSALREYEDSVEPLLELFEVDNVKALSEKLQSNDELYREKAESLGMTTEQYRQYLTLQKDAEKGRQLQAEKERNQMAKAQYDSWMQEAEVLKEVVPNFDLEAECENDEFVEYLKKGISLEKAFTLVHMDEIVNGIESSTADTAKKETISQIRMRNERPKEAGASKARAVVRKSNVKDFTNEDIDEILKQVALGKRIVL